MKICICDDSLDVHSDIKKRLNDKINSDDFFEFTDVFSGEELINFYKNKNTFDIIFLDIEMNGISGIDTAQEIRQYDSRVIIIFVSNHSQYMSDAFRVEALHFIVKPIREYEFDDVFVRAMNKYKLTHSHISFNIKGERHQVLIDDIIYVEGYHRYITVHTQNYSVEAVGKINEILAKLEPHGFVKVHQGFIVNLSCIRHISKNDITLSNGAKVMVSVRRRAETIKAYDNYINTLRW